MRITWRKAKERLNVAKHGLPYRLAEQVFTDRLSETLWDRISDGEERWRTIGAVVLGRSFKVVVSCIPTPIQTMNPGSTQSASERQRRMNDENTKYHVSDGVALTPEEIEGLDAIEARFGGDTDIPETSDAAWAAAIRGKHAGNAQVGISINLDADVAAWLRQKGPGYRREINRILRERMLRER